MAIDGTAGKPSFLKQIGNWFNKNGNTVGRAMQITGSAAMGVGMTGMFINEMKHPTTSIFGGGFCRCNPFSMFGGMASIDPMGMTGWMNGMSGMYGMNGSFGMGGLFGYGNMGGCTSMMGQNLAYQMGMNARMQDMASARNNYAYLNNNQQILQNNSNTANDIINFDTGDSDGKKKINSEFAKLDENHETENGKNFYNGLLGFYNKNNDLIEGKSFELCNTQEAKDAEKYKEAISKYAKSYIAYIEKSDGNGKDGLSLDEFIQHNTKRYDDKALKQSVKIQAGIAFKKLDLNNDGKLDWKEYAATIRTFDMNSNGKINGVINSEDFNKWSIYLADPNKADFDNAMKENYRKLFGEG